MELYRFTGISKNGKTVQTEFEAESYREAKKRVDRLVQSKPITFKSLDKKQIFEFKAKQNGAAKVSGEQEAYTADELKQALQRMGYSDVKVQRKLLDFKGGVPQQEVVSFIRLCSDLLNQKLGFDEILTLLYEDTHNKRMKETIKQIQNDLREGKEGDEVYGKHEKVFGRFASYMLGVASTSGNMAEVFESTANFMERDAQFRKNLRRALLMPTITLLAVIGVVIFYVGYIFPATAEMFLEFNIQLPPMTAATLEWSYWLQDWWWLITLVIIAPFAGTFAASRTTEGRKWLDKNLIKIPVIGDLMHKTSIEIFSRVFYTLYSGSGQNVDVMRVAAEACRNKYIEHQVKYVAIRRMLEDGAGLIESLEQTKVFPRSALSRFRLGAESGSLKENAKQLADYYQTQTTYKMDAVVEMINLGVNVLILIVLTFITVVSSEAALIQPDSGGMGM